MKNFVAVMFLSVLVLMSGCAGKIEWVPVNGYCTDETTTHQGGKVIGKSSKKSSCAPVFYSGRPTLYSEEETAKRELAFGPTVANYGDEEKWGTVFSGRGCPVTGNWGVDGVCMKNQAPILLALQKECEDDPKSCSKLQFNPGKWAGYFKRLGEELIAKQQKANDGLLKEGEKLAPSKKPSKDAVIPIFTP